MAGSLNQCLIQKAIERILDGGYIVTHFPGQQSFVDKKVNFGFVNLKRKATKFIAGDIVACARRLASILQPWLLAAPSWPIACAELT